MLGTAAAPQEAWLVQRGIKRPFGVPIRQICATSQRIAEFLAAHPAVAQVHYPGLPGHPDHLLAAKQMPGGFGGRADRRLGAGTGGLRPGHPDVLPGPRTFGPHGQDLRQLPGRGQIRWIGAMADQIIVGDRILLDVSFSAVRDRLGILAKDGMLPCVSEVAYGEGITDLVKMAGPAAGLTRLAGARLDDVAGNRGLRPRGAPVGGHRS